MQSRMRQLARRLVACTAAAVAVAGSVLVASATPAGAVGTAGFSLAPMSPPGAITPRGAFHYDLRPGETIADSVVLTNETNQLQQFELWPADAYNTPAGGDYALRPYGYRMTGVGTWVDLRVGPGIHGLPAHSSVTINFTVTVPANATPGDHAGGIVALDVTPQSPVSTGKTHFVVHEGVADAIFVRVQGPIHAAAVVNRISVADSTPALGFGGSHATISYQLENTGNTVLSGFVHVTVTDLFGRTVKTFKPISVQKFVPGGRFTGTEPAWAPLPFAGPETVHVRFVATGLPTVTAATTFWILPWGLGLIVLAALAGLGALFVWRRRSRSGGTATPDDTPPVPDADEAATPDVPVDAVV